MARAIQMLFVTKKPLVLTPPAQLEIDPNVVVAAEVPIQEKDDRGKGKGSRRKKVKRK